MGDSPRRADRPKALRQSNLATFDRCALSAKFVADYERDWSSHAQARGTMFHRVAATCLRAMYERKENQIPADVARAILANELRQDGVDDFCGMCGAPAKFDLTRGPMGRVVCAEGHEHGSSFVNIPFSELADLRWVVVKFANDNAFNIEDLVDVEQRLLAEVAAPDLPDGENRTLTGQLDALFITGDRADHAIVLDWKDTWDLPAPTEVGFDGYFQQRFYAWLIFRNYPTVQRVTLRELYVRRSEHREADVWRHEAESVEAELAALAERYDRAFREGNFPPTPGRHCTMCPLPMQCPIFPSVRGAGAISTEEQAQQAARELAVAKAVAKRRDEALKAWASVKGPVEVSSHKGPRAVGFIERTRTSRPTKEQMEAAIAAARQGVPLAMDDLYKTSKVTVFTEHQPEQPPEDPGDAELTAALEASIAQAADRRTASERPAA